MATQLLRGALIGCGFFGQFQLEAWRRMKDVEIVATCDADPARGATFTDAAKMLETQALDFVDIATRPESHLALTGLAVSRKLPVILQKPMAPDLAQAREIAELAEASGVPVMIHENWRWQPWHREMRRRVMAGDIGVPFGYHFTMTSNDGLGENPYAAQPYFRSMPKLILFESLVHPIDVARFYFGDIERVSAVARRRNPLIAGEDRAVVLLTHRDLDGVVEGNRYLLPEPSGPAMGHSLIEGEAGRLQVLATGELYCNGVKAWQWEGTAGYKGDSVKATQEHFIACLRSGEESETSARRYLGSFAAVEAAYQSIAEQRSIAL